VEKIILKFLLASMKSITDLKILYKIIFKELVRKQEQDSYTMAELVSVFQESK
jgi:hypothetical protein